MTSFKMFKTYFKIGPSGSQVVFSGTGSGLVPPAPPEPQDMRQIPSQSEGAQFEPVGTSQYTFDWTTDFNDRSKVVYSWAGQELEWELGFNATTTVDADGYHVDSPTAGEKWTGKCFMTSKPGPANDSGGYALTIPCQGNGIITRSTY